MTDKAQVEHVARAIYKAGWERDYWGLRLKQPPVPWRLRTEMQKEAFRHVAKAAIRAMKEP